MNEKRFLREHFVNQTQDKKNDLAENLMYEVTCLLDNKGLSSNDWYFLLNMQKQLNSGVSKKALRSMEKHVERMNYFYKKQTEVER